MDDSTFRAYRRDPKFLRTILQISPELDTILGRVFEADPRKRVTLPELRNLILACPRLTTTYHEVVQASAFPAVENMNTGFVMPPSPPETPPPALFPDQYQPWSGIGSHRGSFSSYSSGSDDDSDSSSLPGDSPCTTHYDFYGSVIPLTDADQKPFIQSGFGPAMVDVY